MIPLIYQLAVDHETTNNFQLLLGAGFGMHERWLKSFLYSVWKHGMQSRVAMICTKWNLYAEYISHTKLTDAIYTCDYLIGCDYLICCD